MKKKSLSKADIISIVVGCVIGVACICGLVFFLVRRQINKDAAAAELSGAAERSKSDPAAVTRRVSERSGMEGHASSSGCSGAGSNRGSSVTGSQREYGNVLAWGTAHEPPHQHHRHRQQQHQLAAGNRPSTAHVEDASEGDYVVPVAASPVSKSRH